jgi:hypothetical protein
MKGPNEKPLLLDMHSGEALRRFIGTRPAEVAERVGRKRKAGITEAIPPVKLGDKLPKRPAKQLG